MFIGGGSRGDGKSGPRSTVLWDFLGQTTSTTANFQADSRNPDHSEKRTGGPGVGASRVRRGPPGPLLVRHYEATNF